MQSATMLEYQVDKDLIEYAIVPDAPKFDSPDPKAPHQQRFPVRPNQAMWPY